MIFQTSLCLMHKSNGFRCLLASLFLALFCLSCAANAHFSYSDPRIIHIAERDEGGSVVLIRMPAPLALLPDDWQGSAEQRLPPFGADFNGETVLDVSAVTRGDAALRDRLRRAVALWIGGLPADARVDQYRFWTDDARPRFGTRKAALTAFDAPYDPGALAQLPYFDLTLDVMLSVPLASLSNEVRLTSDLGRQFEVIDKFGTVVKLHRGDATETSAAMGVLDLSFPRTRTKAQILFEAALSGAEHIYRGLDHLAMILLIAIAAKGWRQALSWASAFTLGHMVTLAAGLYGIAPAAAWFVPLVELGIALSIIVAGGAVFLRRDYRFAWAGLLLIGLVHGYGFAASASEALFAGPFDPMDLAAFALGLELCQFAIYALALPMILLVDRIMPAMRFGWRRAVALSVAVAACSAVISRLAEVSGTFAIA
ncbi:HupE/UreJ family protein [Ruegeria sp. HKCCD8929]|uniref:HupE/UreJ family protein n=1 Tax=Ruegeria sp. HKCCD8929 TaxID=2683006 RepID=UPI001488FD38|nr:HupE/UreJ family protein [Ruegeria sp. HKCCD8929]